MGHGELVDHLAGMLIGVAPDVLEGVLDSLADGNFDLGALSHDDAVELVRAAVSAAAGAASKQYLERNRDEVRAAIGRALTGS